MQVSHGLHWLQYGYSVQSLINLRFPSLFYKFNLRVKGLLKNIVSKLQGVSEKKILDGICNNVHGDISRVHLVTLQDIQNICRIEMENLKNEDKLLVIQTEFQKYMMVKFGNNIVSLDATDDRYGIKQDDMESSDLVEWIQCSTCDIWVHKSCVHASINDFICSSCSYMLNFSVM